MWVWIAFASALFAGVTAVLAKVGIRDTDSNLATAIRTVVILAFSWAMVFVAGSQRTLGEVDGHTLLFLVLSGLATGASWLCYFRALQLGDVNKVTPVDKSSTVLTMLLAALLLGERITPLKLACMLAIGAGTYLMIAKRQRQTAPARQGHAWLLWAALSAVFASLTAILGKIGIRDIESNLGTAIRTGVVLVLAWGIVIGNGKVREIGRIGRRSWVFLCLSGITTGLSWLCYYRALQDGPASVVVPIDKLSILVTILFSGVVLHERLSKKAAAGLALIVGGTLALLGA